MNQNREIKNFHKGDISINEIHEYHTKIIQNHLNPLSFKTNTNELIETSALITPNQLYEQKLKQCVKEREEKTTSLD